jgi:hypothetical protein
MAQSLRARLEATEEDVEGGGDELRRLRARRKLAEPDVGRGSTGQVLALPFTSQPTPGAGASADDSPPAAL